MNLGKTNTLPGCSEFHGQATAAAGAATLTFSNTSLTPRTPGHAATARRGAAATGAVTPILSNSKKKMCGAFMFHSPSYSGQCRTGYAEPQGSPGASCG